MFWNFLWNIKDVIDSMLMVRIKLELSHEALPSRNGNMWEELTLHLWIWLVVTLRNCGRRAVLWEICVTALWWDKIFHSPGYSWQWLVDWAQGWAAPQHLGLVAALGWREGPGEDVDCDPKRTVREEWQRRWRVQWPVDWFVPSGTVVVVGDYDFAYIVGFDGTAVVGYTAAFAADWCSSVFLQ